MEICKNGRLDALGCMNNADFFGGRGNVYGKVELMCLLRVFVRN